MRTRNLLFVFLVTLLAVYLVYGFKSGNSLIQQNQADNKNLPQNPLDGRIVFERSGCIDCHSINGFGGKTAPNFGSENFLIGDYDLITDMWNHSPKMLKMIEETKANQHRLTPEDFHKLRYFIYFLGFISNNGSVIKGQELFTKMNCANCHSIGKSVAGKINLNKIGYYASPIYLAQVMWNHAAQMHKKLKSSKIQMPLFKGNEFADLAAYLETVSTFGNRNKNYMLPGNPVEGEKLFNSKLCSFCHIKNDIGPSLNKIDLHKNVNVISGILWNHSDVMSSYMTKHNISWPKFKNDEMGNLLAYLYFYNNKHVKGSVEEGKEILAEKGCLNCHNYNNSLRILAASDIKPFNNIDEFFSKLWNHLPLIEKDFYTKGKELPNLKPEDVKSMYLYFCRSRK
jgi:cytochrome c2